MRRLLLVFVLFFSLFVHSQDSTGSNNYVQGNEKLTNDSPTLDDAILTDTSQAAEIREGNMQRVLELTQEMEKRREREKRNAMIRIGIGVLFLGILVIGLLRKKKK